MESGSLLITDIGTLVTNDVSSGAGGLGIREGAAVVMENGRIAWLGDAALAPAADARHSVERRAVLPGFVESHAHLVFAGERSREFAARMSGQSYDAGGIRTTIEATRAATDDELAANVARLMSESHRGGSTTVECKTGYGQTVHDELRSARIASGFTDEVTLLAAHVPPPEFAERADDYVRLVCEEMIPAAARYARWIDVFCERGAFDADQARQVLATGKAHGLVPRVHGNQLGPGPGAQLAVETGAASLDHATHLSEADIEALSGGDTVVTLLPGAEFSTRSPYPDARRLLAAGVTVALGTDCNPGTSYTTSMSFCIAVAVREMHLTPDEAVWAATAGGAAALRRTDVGVLSVGARADLIVLDAPDHVHLAYRPGVPLVRDVYREGRLVHGPHSQGVS